MLSSQGRCFACHCPAASACTARHGEGTGASLAPWQGTARGALQPNDLPSSCLHCAMCRASGSSQTGGAALRATRYGYTADTTVTPTSLMESRAGSFPPFSIQHQRCAAARSGDSAEAACRARRSAAVAACGRSSSSYMPSILTRSDLSPMISPSRPDFPSPHG